MQIAALQEHTVNKEVSWFRMCIIYFISQWVIVIKPVTVQKEKRYFY